MSWLASMQAAIDGQHAHQVGVPQQAPTQSHSRLRESIDGTEKLCSRCDEWWPADEEFFYADKGGLKGLMYCCKACYEDRKQALAASRGVAPPASAEQLTTKEPAMIKADIEQDIMYTRQELLDKLGRSRETFRQWVKAGKIPPPDVDLSRKTKGWKKSTLAAAGINL